MGWKQFAEEVRGAESVRANRANRDDSPGIAPNGPFVPIVSHSIDASRALKLWHSHLAPLDAENAREGCREWWGRAVRDSHWIYENYTGQAVRDGWSAHDLFGILPAHPTWGGLTARLRGARDLKMSGPKAAWSNYGVKDWTCRGAGDDMISSGLRPIWEFSHG